MFASARNAPPLFRETLSFTTAPREALFHMLCRASSAKATLPACIQPQAMGLCTRSHAPSRLAWYTMSGVPTATELC